MGWFRRVGVALALTVSTLAGYAVGSNVTDSQTAKTVSEDKSYRMKGEAKTNPTYYGFLGGLAGAAVGNVGLFYVVRKTRRNGDRPETRDGEDRHEMLLIGPLYYRYRDFSDEGKAIVDAQLEEARKKEEAARIKAEQMRETAKKMTAHTNILGGEEEVRRLKEKTKITRVYDKDRTGLQFNAPEYKTVVSHLVDSSVRHDFVANAQTKEYTLRRFDISSNELDRIAEPYAIGLLKIEQAKEEVKKAKTRAEQIAEEMRAAVVKLV